MKKRRPSPLLRGGLMILSIGAVTLLWPRLEPAAVALLQKAALFTTVLDMPTGALETLRERYAAELEPAPLPEEPSEPPSQTRRNRKFLLKYQRYRRNTGAR